MDFPSTHWSMLAQATLHGDPTARQSLDTFCCRYRAPVMALLRRRGVTESRIEDMTHDFFLQLMEHSSLKRADPALGRFRSFIHGSLVRFLADDVDHNHAQKRGGGAVHLNLDEADGVAGHLGAPDDDESLFLDREWALNLVAHALESVRRQWSTPEKTARFAVLRAFLPGAMEIISQNEAAERLELSDTALRTELHRLRESFRCAVRAEVEATVSSREEAADEMRHLVRVLSTPPPSETLPSKDFLPHSPSFS